MDDPAKFGDRLMRDPAEATDFNRSRCKGVMEVRNDSAEWLLVRAGLAKP